MTETNALTIETNENGNTYAYRAGVLVGMIEPMGNSFSVVGANGRTLGFNKSIESATARLVENV